MQWGVRRYQNPDGSLTAAGKKRVSQRRPDDIVIKKGTQLNNVGSKENLKLRGNVKGVPNPFGPSAVALSLPLSAALGNPLPAVAAIGTSVIPVKRSDNEKKLFVYREDDPHDKDVYEGAFTKFIKYLKNIGSERLTPEYMADAEKRLRYYMKDTYGNDSISI